MIKSKYTFLNSILLFIVLLIIILTMTGCIEVLSDNTTCPSSNPSPISCTNLTIYDDTKGYNYITLQGWVYNDCSEEISCLHVQGVCYDVVGREEGRNEIYWGNIPTGKTLRFKISIDIKKDQFYSETDRCTLEIIEGAYK